MTSDASNDLKAAGREARHVAKVDVRLGSMTMHSKLAISTGGLLAVSALVGVILAGTAGIVWVATGPARRRAERGHQK